MKIRAEIHSTGRLYSLSVSSWVEAHFQAKLCFKQLRDKASMLSRNSELLHDCVNVEGLTLVLAQIIENAEW